VSQQLDTFRVMDTFETIRSRLSIMHFKKASVPWEVKMEILEAARLSPSGINSQHWRFILINESQDLATLAKLSTTGKWVESADFAVVVLTNQEYPFHLLDAGQAIMSMALAAWNRGVGSRIYTGFNRERMREFLGLSQTDETGETLDLTITAVVGFGYPARKVVGRKKRLPLERIAFKGKYGVPLRV